MRRTWMASVPLACLVAAMGRGGDDVVVDDVGRQQPAEVVRFAPVHVQMLGAQQAIRQVEYDLVAMFDQQVFRRILVRRQARIVGGQIERVVEGPPAGDTLGRLGDLRRRAAARIAILEGVCGLDERQRAVLELAVESDLRRLAAEIDVVRRKYAGRKLQAAPQGDHRQLLQELRDDAVTCRSRIEQFWRKDSLLGSLAGSSTAGVLSQDQQAAIADWLAGRRATRWEAMVRTVLGGLDESTLGLSTAQHDALFERLLADVPPLAVFDDLSAGSGLPRAVDLQTLVVVECLGRVETDDLRPLFDARQWLALEQFVEQHGSSVVVRQLLVEQGVLEE